MQKPVGGVSVFGAVENIGKPSPPTSKKPSSGGGGGGGLFNEEEDLFSASPSRSAVSLVPRLAVSGHQ